MKNYNESVNYLYGLQRHGIKLGLRNPRRLMSILGRPQDSFHSVHIAGTNGKGSTAIMIASILEKNGFKVGLYTSPHLVSFTERIRVNNYPVSESDVARLTYFIRKATGDKDVKPTFFEFVTAMAFYYFACEKVDWAVVETGMGGRLDATNVLLPDVSVITNIGPDHSEYLGETIVEIAREKAGIIKPSVPLVTSTTRPEALSVLEKYAKDSRSDIHVYGRDFKSTLNSMDDKHLVFDYIGIDQSRTHIDNCRKYKNLSIPIAGKHQLYNASLAIRACETLIQRGFSLSPETIINGLLSVNFEGRLEWISRTPPVIIDSAHNPEAARALADTVKEIFPDKKIILIVGIMKDKDIKGILGHLMQISGTLILTKAKGERAASPEKLKEYTAALRETGDKHLMSGSISTTHTVAEAVKRAKTFCHENNIILATGSFYITGEVKHLLSHTTGILSHLRE